MIIPLNSFSLISLGSKISKVLGLNFEGCFCLWNYGLLADLQTNDDLYIINELNYVGGVIW